MPAVCLKIAFDIQLRRVITWQRSDLVPNPASQYRVPCAPATEAQMRQMQAMVDQQAKQVRVLQVHVHELTQELAATRQVDGVSGSLNAPSSTSAGSSE